MDNKDFISYVSNVGNNDLAFRLMGTRKLYAYELNKLDEDYDLGWNFVYEINSNSKIHYLSANCQNDVKLRSLIDRKSVNSLDNPVDVRILHSYTVDGHEGLSATRIKFESIRESERPLLNLVQLNFDILCSVSGNEKLSEIGKQFDREIRQSLLQQFKSGFQYYNEVLHGDVESLTNCYYVLKDRVMSIVLPESVRDDSVILRDIAERLNVTRDSLSRDLMLFPSRKMMEKMSVNNMKLINPHKKLRSEFIEESVVKGRYTYYHYLQDGDRDKGWGCAYRSLQTIASWYAWAGHNVDVPSLKQIQQMLVELGDKSEDFVGSRKWIGSFEINLVLQKLLNTDNRIIPVNKGSEIPDLYHEIAEHFMDGGGPIMIGGGELAHTIIGVAKETGTDKIKFLILDPHFVASKPAAPDTVEEVISGKWVGWKDSKFWKDKLPYNLCLPGKIE